MTKVLMFLPPVLFAGLAALFIVGMNREDPDGLPSALAGKQAPAVQVTPLGEFPAFTDADLRKPGAKLVNFWASWCAPCRAEHPLLEQLAREGIPIYGVNYKDRPDDAQGFLAELGNPFTAIGADAGRMALDWGVYGVPETYVIDRDGVIRYKKIGPVTPETVREKILPLVKQLKG